MQGKVVGLTLAIFSLHLGGDLHAQDSTEDSKNQEAIERILSLPSYEIRRTLETGGAQDSDAQQPPSQQIKIGDSLSFELSPQELESKLEPDMQFQWQLLPGSSPLFEQGWMHQGLPQLQGGKIKFRSVPLQAGKLSLPQMVLIGIKKGSEEKVELLRTEPVSVEVLPALDPQDPRNQNQPAPFYPPARVTKPLMGYVSSGLILVLLIVGTIVAYRIWARGRRRQPVTFVIPEARKKSEDVVALNDLMRLEALKLHEKRAYKGLYFGASEILKTYLGRRFQFDALESTSDELFSQLQRLGIAPLALERLVSLFSKLDRVKFTDQIPDRVEAQEIIENARDIISLTKRVAVTPGLSNVVPSSGGAHATQ